MSKNVNLVSQEGDKFEVSREIAMMSNLVKEMLGEEDGDGDGEEQEIPLPNVHSTTLSKAPSRARGCAHAKGSLRGMAGKRRRGSSATWHLARSWIT